MNSLLSGFVLVLVLGLAETVDGAVFVSDAISDE
jgi:hypothetical protein